MIELHSSRALDASAPRNASLLVLKNMVKKSLNVFTTAFDNIDSIVKSGIGYCIELTVCEEPKMIETILMLIKFSKYEFNQHITDRVASFQWQSEDPHAFVRIVVKRNFELTKEQNITDQKKQIEDSIKIYKNHLFYNDQFDVEPDFDKMFNEYTPKAWR